MPPVTAQNTLVPKKASIHFDDLLQQFYLKITFQFQTPLGVFQREVRITAANLAAAITDLLNTWGAAPTGVEPASFGVYAPIGDLEHLGPFTSPLQVTYVAQEVPDVDVPTFESWTPGTVSWT